MLNLLSLPREDRLNAISAIITKANSYGMDGWGGACGVTALAMQQVLFSGQGEIVGGFNCAFAEKDEAIGHVVVRVPDEIEGYLNFDATGNPVPDENIDSWGMLDFQDSMWDDRARERGIEWNEEAAMEAALYVMTPEDVTKMLPAGDLEETMALLNDAARVLGYKPIELAPHVSTVDMLQDAATVLGYENIETTANVPGSLSTCAAASEKPALCVPGLPAHVDLHSPYLYALKEALERDIFTFEVTDKSDHYGEKYSMDIGLKNIPAHWEMSPRGQFYNPNYFCVGEFSRLETIDASTFNAPDGKEEGYLFRGMAYEEFCQARTRGYFESSGSHNLGDEQIGLTYFSKDKGQASYYASGFAPWQHKPAVDRPAVMVKIRDPGDHVIAAGTGENEVGLRGRLPFSLFVAADFAHPIAIYPGYLEIVEKQWAKDNKFDTGSASGMSVSVRWSPNEFGLANEVAFLVQPKKVDANLAISLELDNAIRAKQVIEQAEAAMKLRSFTKI